MNTTGGRPVAFVRSTCCISCSTIVVASVLENLESFMVGRTTDGSFKVVWGEEIVSAKRLVKHQVYIQGFKAGVEEAISVINDGIVSEKSPCITGDLN